MRRTALALMPLARAIRSAVQWVVSTGGSASVSATTRAATSGPSGGDAFGARSETQRRRNIPRMARNRGISKAHSQITVKTGLAGWGGRIRTSASGIVPNWVYRYRAAQRVAADRARSDLSARHDSSKSFKTVSRDPLGGSFLPGDLDDARPSLAVN